MKSDVIEPISCSEWATPTVDVLKGEREVWICVDLKLTLNPQLEMNQYALPTAKDLFTTLNSRQKFTKLDLRHA